MQQTAVEAFAGNGIAEDKLIQLMECLEAADKVFTENTELREALSSILSPYFNGEITAEEAVAQVMNYIPSIMNFD